MSKKNLANKFKGKSLGNLIILSLIFLLFAVLIDLKIINKSWFIIVDREYIYYVYAALATISTICITVLSLIINSLDKRYYGVPIKVYLNIRRNIFNIKYFISFILIIISFSTFLLAKNMVNALGILFVFIIVYISYASINLWDLITNDDICFNKISDMIRRNQINKKVKKQQILNYLFTGLNDYSEGVNTSYIQNNVDLIIYISNQIEEEIDKNDYYNKLRKSAKTIFNLVNIEVSLKEVFRIINSIGISFNSREVENIIQPIILEVQYLNFIEYELRKYDKIINFLEENVLIDDDVKIFILYKLFDALYNNEVFTKKEKVNILNEFISQLTYMGDKPDSFIQDKQKILLMILKYKILDNTNYNQSEFLIMQILEVLDLNTGLSYKNNPHYFETVALIYLVIYLYSESEVETLIPEHRDKIKDLINIEKNKLSPKEGTFKSLIIKNFDEIVIALLNIKKEKYNSLHFLENFTDLNYSKSVVWDISAGFDFAMCNFFFSYHYQYPYELINNWENIEDKRLYLQRIQEFFSIDSANKISLTQKKTRKMKKIKNWIGFEHEVNTIKIQNLFTKNNELLKELNIENKIVINYKEVSEKIKKLVNENFEKSKLDEYSNSIELSEDDKEYYFAEIKESQYLQEQYHEYIVGRIYEKLLQILYNEISKSIKPKKFDYNIYGVESLIEDLNSNSYTKTNFNLINELLYFKNKLKADNWDFLEQLNLENVENKYLKSKVVYKGYLPKFNIKVKEYKIEKLNDTECEKYSENFKISNEYYKIDNAYYTKSEVMDLIYEKNRKVVVIYTFKIEKPNNFSGIKLKFDYTKLEKEDEK
ncbi:MAG: hypothetical protein EOL97_13100 [Spirochaetia bacterium]|nr:hypothetical protein [Spirochaetia bacterium]